MPPLPPGSTAQPVWGFRDPSGAFTYEFNRCYGPVRFLPHRGGIEGEALDEGRSFWIVTWAGAGGTEDEHACGRWIDYAEARRLLGSRLTFARFSALEDMRDVLPGLLRVRAERAQRVLSSRPTTTMDVMTPSLADVSQAAIPRTLR